jgi:FKBP-type peptidyl-prolyl cis-trans isomerase FkpA
LVTGAGAFVVLVLAGAGVWWKVQRDNAADEASTQSRGGSIALDTSGTQGSQGMTLGGQTPEGAGKPQSVTDLDTGMTSGDKASAGGTAGPSREELATYDKYKDAQDVRYGDIVKGGGPEVKAGSKVTINYRGWLTNGSLFDDSYAKGLVGMKECGRRRLVIPPAGGYGAQTTEAIPANSVLVFDIELEKVQ